jgi:signal transduction histidine kinase
VAHEVKNPLAGLLLYSLHLRDMLEKPSPEVALVDKIVDTINHLNRRVEHILGFARPLSLTAQSGNLNQIINDILELLRSQVTANQIEVRLSLDEQNASWMIDESSMRGALMNLIVNAIEAMPGGGTLSIDSKWTEETLQLEITDTGGGIADDQIKKIFEPFYTTKEQGLGLGMPYAKKIIEEHGGSVSLNTKSGEGTTIRITLPANREEVERAS